MTDCCCGECCGPTRCLPTSACAKPLPRTLNIQVSGTYPPGPFGGGGACDCLAFTGTITFYGFGEVNPHTGVPNVWATTFTACGVSYRYSLGCTNNGKGWRAAFLNGNGAGTNLGNCLESDVMHPDGIAMEMASCDPLVLVGQFFTSGIGCCGPSHLVGLATLNVVIWEDTP